MIKVSVILPVYNMEKFVSKAIESWKAQTIEEKELICVDDCSTDNTYEVLKSYRETGSNIVIYRMSENSGPATCRNYGLSIAKGEYIAFLDADDQYINKDSLKRMYTQAIQGQCDICGGLLQKYRLNTYYKYPRFRGLFQDDKEWSLPNQDLYNDYFYQAFIFNNKFLMDNDINFPTLRRYQDPPFLAKSIILATKVRIVNIEFYLHDETESKKLSIEAINCIFSGMLLNLKLAEEYKADWLTKVTINRMNKECFFLAYQVINSNNNKGIELIYKIQEYAKKNNNDLHILDYINNYNKNKEDAEAYYYSRILNDYFKSNEHIIIYGAGNIGKTLIKSTQYYDSCIVDKWIDKNKAGTKEFDITISSINEIDFTDNAKILIAIADLAVSEEVFESLVSLGIDKGRLVKWVDVI